MPAHRDVLCQLDTGIGDGDHGVTVERGFSAVTALFAGNPADGGQTFYQKLGDELSMRVGGAIGPIYGLFFQGIGLGLSPVETVYASNLCIKLGMSGIPFTSRLSTPPFLCWSSMSTNIRQP